LCKNSGSLLKCRDSIPQPDQQLEHLLGLYLLP